MGARVLILWNQVGEDVYAHFRRDGRRAPTWDPTLEVEPWDTVEQEMDLIVRAATSGGHDVRVVNIRDSFDALLSALRTEPPDIVMNLVEFLGDDPELEYHVPALYELLGIEYTGNRPLALSVCQKKPHAKALLTDAGLAVPRGALVTTADEARDLDLRYPLIAKPAFDDASGGIDTGSVVHTADELAARVQLLIHEQGAPPLVEEYIDGREIHCAILGDTPLPLYEMRFKGGVDEHGTPLPRIITYNAKWDPYSREHHAVEGVCPAPDLSPAVSAQLQATALRAFRALGCRDYARVDMRLDAETGEPYVLEVNPNPDLAETCAFTASARASGRSYEQMICEILDLALARKRSPEPVVEGVDGLLYDYLEQKKQSG